MGKRKGHRKQRLRLPQASLRKRSKGLPRECTHEALRRREAVLEPAGQGRPHWLHWCCVSAALEGQVRSRRGRPMDTGVIFCKLCCGELTHVQMCTILSCDWAFSITFKQVALLMKRKNFLRIESQSFPLSFVFFL